MKLRISSAFGMANRYREAFLRHDIGIRWLDQIGIPKSRDGREIRGASHSTKTSENSGCGSEWNRHFPKFHSEIFGVPHEIGLKFRKIGITRKFRSIRPFLLRPSFSDNNNSKWHTRTPTTVWPVPYECAWKSTWLILKLPNIILVLSLKNDWSILLQLYCNGLAWTSFSE